MIPIVAFALTLFLSFSCQAGVRIEPLWCVMIKIHDAQAKQELDARVNQIAEDQRLIGDRENPGTYSYRTSDGSALLLYGRNMSYGGTGGVISVYEKSATCPKCLAITEALKVNLAERFVLEECASGQDYLTD